MINVNTCTFRPREEPICFWEGHGFCSEPRYWFIISNLEQMSNVSILFVESCLRENRSNLSRSWTTVAWDCGTGLVSSSRIASALAKSLALRASARAWLRSGEFELWSNHCSQSSSEFEHCDTRFEHTPSSVSTPSQTQSMNMNYIWYNMFKQK